MAEMQRTLQALLETTSFAAFGFRVVQADEGRTRLYVPARASHLRPGEIVAGYVLVAAADVAVWLAIKNATGRRRPFGDDRPAYDLLVCCCFGL